MPQIGASADEQEHQGQERLEVEKGRLEGVSQARILTMIFLKI